MRVAVTIPNLPATAVERHQIEAAVGALAERAEVELFAESTRLQGEELPAPAYHYLRLPERHAAHPFASALHIVGRDYRPYEAAILTARRLPSAVWILDTMTHHVLVGGLGPFGRWDAYGDIIRAARTDGDAVGATIAAGWGTRAVFRERDPLPELLGRDNRIIVATHELAGRFGAETPVVPLPTDVAVLRRRAEPPRSVRSVAVVAPNLSWPAPELRALAAFMDAHPDVEVRYHLIKWFAPGVLGPADDAGVRDRIEWVIEDGIEQRTEVAAGADAVVAATGDPTLNDRGLVRQAMAAGKVVVVVRAPAWEELPAGSAVVVEPGRERERGLSATLSALVEDPDLALAIGTTAAGYAGDVTVAEVGEQLLRELDTVASLGAPELRGAAGATRAVVRSHLLDAATPHNASAETRSLITELIEDVMPGTNAAAS